MTRDECKFFIPGPTWVRPALLQEMLRPMIGHRSAEFKDLFTRIVAGLKPLFVTQLESAPCMSPVPEQVATKTSCDVANNGLRFATMPRKSSLNSALR